MSIILTGTEFFEVTPLRWDGTPAPVTERITVGQIAALGSGYVSYSNLLTLLLSLPTTEPALPAQLWLNGGALCVS